MDFLRNLFRSCCVCIRRKEEESIISRHMRRVHGPDWKEKCEERRQRRILEKKRFEAWEKRNRRSRSASTRSNGSRSRSNRSHGSRPLSSQRNSQRSRYEDYTRSRRREMRRQSAEEDLRMRPSEVMRASWYRALVEPQPQQQSRRSRTQNSRAISYY